MEYKEGYIYEINNQNDNGTNGDNGDLVVMVRHAYSDIDVLFLTGSHKGKEKLKFKKNLLQVYPLPKTINISIDGKDTEISRESAEALKELLNKTV